jgi:phage-related minor tail protein
MAETIKGIVVTIGADTTALGKALGDVNAKSRDLQSELKQVDKLLKLDPTNTELVAQKQELLTQAIAATTTKLNTLRDAQAQVNDQFAKGEIKEGQYRAFQRECEATEQQLQRLEQQLEATKKSFDLGDAVAKASASLKTAGKNMKDTGKSLTEGLTVPIVGAVAGLTVLATKTAQAGDEMDEMAARTGFSVEALSEYKYVAGLAGVELDGLEVAVKKMQNTVTDAQNGTKAAAAALDQLGISAQSLRGLSPEEQFDRIAAAVAGIEDPTRRAALAQDVFGRSGTDLLPMLAGGADGIARLRQEARDLGVVWTNESAAAAAKFSDDLERVKAGVAGAFQQVSSKLLPVLSEKLVPVIEKHVVPLIQKLAEKIGNLVEWFANLDPKWQAVILAAVGFLAVIGPLLIILGSLATAIGVLMSPIGLVVLAIGAVIAAGVALAMHWDDVKAAAGRVWAAIVDVVRSAVNPIIGFINAIIAGAEGMVNAIVRAINSIPSITIPDWVPGIGGRTFGIPKLPLASFPRIPLLAEGAVFSRPTLGIFAEAGEAEAAMPLSSLQPMMTTAVVEAMRQLTGGAQSSGTSTTPPAPVEAVLVVDGVKLARVMLPRLTAEKQRMGIEQL